jgi:BirA family transcriptional regulator, biotin operon repressor / biotin---[acetyl-CoA-carboxylase] ligase
MRYGRSHRALEVTESTNDDARRDALAGAPNGHVVTAEAQTRGRGSNGRSWSSPPGQDLFVSIVDRPKLPLVHLPPLTLAVGLGVARAVETLLEGRFRSEVKWPNDVWLAGKKCAGVLVESSTSGAAIDYVVIGIGLNVNRLEFDLELREIATSLRACTPEAGPFDRKQVLAVLLDSVEREVDRYVAVGPAAIVQDLEPRLALLGRRARCGDVQGIVAGVSATGALRMHTERGVLELHSGRLTCED